VIATSQKVELKGIDEKVVEKVGEEGYFAREKASKKTGEDQFFGQGEQGEVSLHFLFSLSNREGKALWDGPG